MNKQLINVLLLVLACLVLLFPNSFQLPTAALIVLINMLIFNNEKKIIIPGYFIFFWLLLSSFFIIYITISDIPSKHKTELYLKYILFPFFWMHIFSYIKKYFKFELITKVFFYFSFLSFFVVLFLYWSKLMGYSYIDIFFENANIDSNYFIGFTLHVYGNLIFFASGIFILPIVVKNTTIHYIYIIIFTIVTILSGRTALLISFAIGIMILFTNYIILRKYRPILIYATCFLIFVIALNYYTESQLNYSFFDYIQVGSIEKLQSLGGTERTKQSSLILYQIIHYPWGIGFSNIGIERNAEKSFNYEVLILATIMRFGVIVFFLVMVSLTPIIKNLVQFSRLDEYQKFYLIGFLSIITFSFTNPYLESFSFQWMFFCPLIFLLNSQEDSYLLKKDVKLTI